MSIEFDLDAASGIDFSNVFAKEESDECKTADFHGKIFSPPYYPTGFSKKAETTLPGSQETKKADTLATDKLNAKVTKHRERDQEGGSVEAGARATWGGGDGVKFDLYMNAEAHDNQGNYVEVEATQSSSGQGSLDVHAGTNTDSN